MHDDLFHLSHFEGFCQPLFADFDRLPMTPTTRNAFLSSFSADDGHEILGSGRHAHFSETQRR